MEVRACLKVDVRSQCISHVQFVYGRYVPIPTSLVTNMRTAWVVVIVFLPLPVVCLHFGCRIYRLRGCRYLNASRTSHCWHDCCCVRGLRDLAPGLLLGEWSGVSRMMVYRGELWASRGVVAWDWCPWQRCRVHACPSQVIDLHTYAMMLGTGCKD
jgi:hypothetical protein